uniref:LRRCT domain-containing protein n=1 Tax=Branchiostoma floridae TaxID=7739 RepID=C3XYU4_BRAFL|eukprot:XP_002610969.1 hypothetical protein BRAFLDRAFT_96308 [Branchiostoma floridae]
MVGRKALVWLLLVSNHLVLLVPEAAQRCPDGCFTRVAFSCRCPNPNGKVSNCSWVGHGGTYVFPVCLDAIPTDFSRETQSVMIEHLSGSSSTLLEQSFHHLRFGRLETLSIRQSNVSAIQPRTFCGLQHLSHLYLPDNRISRLEAETFLGLVKLQVLILEKNKISTVSQHAFQDLHLLKHLRLSHNRLTSVPVDALLRPGALWAADLQMNHITTIYRDALRLTRNKFLSLQIGNNTLRCDKNLTWFICSLSNLTFISERVLMSCASPPELSGTNLIAMRQFFCQTSAERSQRRIGSKTFSEPSLIPTSRIMDSRSSQLFNTRPNSDAIPTEGYAEMPQTMPVTKRTTQMDYVILLAGGPFVNEDANITYIIAMVSAVVVPLSVTAAVLFILILCCGTDLPHEQATSTETETSDIQPYAVAYANSAELRGSDGSPNTSGRNVPVLGKTPEDNCTIQPYAVAYAEDPGSDIQPYAVAYSEDPGPQLQCHAAARCINDQEQVDNYKIQPYAVGYPDPQEDARGCAEAQDSKSLENGSDEQTGNVNQPSVQSEDRRLSTDDDIQPEYGDNEAGRGDDPTSHGKGPYRMDEGNDIAPEAIGMQYGSGSQHAVPNDCSARASHARILFNPIQQNVNVTPLDGMQYDSGSQHAVADEYSARSSQARILFNPPDGQLQCQTRGHSLLYEQELMGAAPPHHDLGTTEDSCH